MQKTLASLRKSDAVDSRAIALSLVFFSQKPNTRVQYLSINEQRLYFQRGLESESGRKVNYLPFPYVLEITAVMPLHQGCGANKLYFWIERTGSSIIRITYCGISYI